VRIVLYYPNYIYGSRDSGSSDKGLKIGVMTRPSHFPSSPLSSTKAVRSRNRGDELQSTFTFRGTVAIPGSIFGLRILGRVAKR